MCLFRAGMLASVLALGIIYMAASMINTSILSIYPLHYAKTGNLSSVSGIMGFATYLGAGISGAAYGVLIKYYGYLPMLVSWAAVSVISLIIIKRIDAQRAKEETQKIGMSC